MKKYTKEEINTNVSIGFCQPRFYKPNSWRKAKDFMQNEVVKNELAYNLDFGRGKGKFSSMLDADFVIEKITSILKAQNRLIH